MKKILRYTAAFSLATATLISASYVSANINKGRISNGGNNGQIFSTRWRIVKQTVRLHIPQNNKPVSQLIIEAPSTVAVSNDIDVRYENGQKIDINISARGRNIIIDFNEKLSDNKIILLELNKVKQPTSGADSVYRFYAKFVSDDVEIFIGEARFVTF